MRLRNLHRAACRVLPILLLAVVAITGVHANEALEDPRLAVERLERSLEADPADVELRLQLADLYASMQRVDDAIAQYEAIIAAIGTATSRGKDASRRLRYLLATRHAERQELDEAITLFGELSEEYPDNVLIHYSLGVANLLQGDTSGARNALERVIAIDPQYINAYVNLATVYEQRGELGRAIELLEAATEIDPGSVAATRARTRLDIIEGDLLSGQGNVHAAIAAYERALVAEPANRAALTALAGLHRGAGDGDAETATYERVVTAYPDDLLSRLRLAELYLAGERHQDAYDQLDAISAQQPPGALAARTEALYEALRATAAGRRIAEGRSVIEIERLTAHLEENPDDLQAWKDLAMLHFQRGDDAGAAAAFEAAKALDPEDRRTRYALAAIYDNTGRFADSAREYAAVLEIEPDEQLRERVAATMQVVNAKHLYVEARYQEAIAEFEDVLAKDADNDLAHFYLGLIYSQEEEMLRAVDAYREVIRIVPAHAGARLNLAASYERLNREEDAIDEYNKILQANPPEHVAELARQGLSNASKRLRGVSANLGYVMAYDDNTNLSASDEVEDFRADLTLNLAYQYRTSNNLRLRFLFSPTYSTYHRGQFDYLNTTATASAGLMRGSYNLVGGYTHRTSESLVAARRIGRMGSLFVEGFTRLKLPPLLRPLSGDRVFSNVSANLSYSEFEGTSNPFFSAYTSTAGLSLSQPVTESTTLRTGYQFVLNSNMELVGSDYAYTSHGLTLGLDHRLPWGAVNANYGLSLFDYTNRDSFSQFTRYRRNVRHNLALGATWRFRPNINLFATLSWVQNQSNLPVGFVLSSEDIIEGLQSSSLSDHERLMFTTGLSVNF